MMHLPANGIARRAAEIRYGFGLVFVLSLALSTSPARAADPIAPQLRDRIDKARDLLGDLPSWQEEIFQNEVLAASGRFVRDYRTSGDKVIKADVDLDGIKRYLAFHASQILKGDTKTLLFVRANAACTDCAKSIAAIRTELKERLERRGLTVVLPTADELKRDPSEAFAKRNAQAWVLAEVRAEDDPDHPGDTRYALLLDFRFPGTAAFGVQKQMEILPSDSLEVSMSRLEIDAVLDLGQKARASFASANSENSGIEVEVMGATQFPLLRELKAKLQGALGSDYRVVEKRIERGGHASLAVHATNPGEKSADGVADLIRKTPFEGFAAQVTNVAPERISVRLVSAGGRG